MTGAVTEVPTIVATTTFTIRVVDPCLTTNLINPSAPLYNMITSVLVATGAVTQQVGIFKDQVSVQYGDSSGT